MCPGTSVSLPDWSIDCTQSIEIPGYGIDNGRKETPSRFYEFFIKECKAGRSAGGMWLTRNPGLKPRVTISFVVTRLVYVKLRTDYSTSMLNVRSTSVSPVAAVETSVLRSGWCLSTTLNVPDIASAVVQPVTNPSGKPLISASR